MGESEQVKVRKATKIAKEEVATLDRAKMGVGQSPRPKEGEVEGQYMRYELVECPWCGTIQWIYADSDVYLWFRCCWCGNCFRA